MIRTSSLLWHGFMGALLLAPTAGWAGTFNTLPTQVTLGEDLHSSLLTLTNTGVDTLRFQVSAYAWNQGLDGNMVLTDTDDLVVFPTLLEVAPGQARRLRVGTSLTPGAVETAYRVFVEELPPLGKSDHAPTGIQVLTRVGIPVFLTPTHRESDVVIQDATVSGGKVHVQMGNEGNVHYMLQEVSVAGDDSHGAEAFNTRSRGWYVLPGEPRSMDFDLPADACTRADRLQIRAITDQGEQTRELSLPTDACTP